MVNDIMTMTFKLFKTINTFFKTSFIYFFLI